MAGARRTKSDPEAIQRRVSDRGSGIRSRNERRPVGGCHPRQEMTSMALYLFSVIDDTTGSATEDEMAAIDAFNDELRAEGHWVFAGGLGSPGTATVVDGRDGEAVFTDGPYLESKEYVAGFWVIEAPDLDLALKLAAEGSKHCNRQVEVRPFL